MSSNVNHASRQLPCAHPKVSVAVFTYNHERFIAQAIESVLAQSVNFEYEIVIGEDCSTDGTRAVVRGFQRRHPDRIRLLLWDRNVGGSRNAAETISACQGEYLAYLEGDDYWTASDKLQRQVDFLDAHPDRSICFGRARILYESGTTGLGEVWPRNPAGPYSIEDLLKCNFVATGTVVLRRKFLVRPKWLSKIKIGDWPTWVLVARYGKIELMDEIFGVYRVHAASTWSSLGYVARVAETTRMLRALDEELAHQYVDIIKETISAFYIDLALRSRSEGRRIETAKHIANYIRNAGWRRSGSARFVAGMIAYVLIGSWYKILSRRKSVNAGGSSGNDGLGPGT